jgi:1-deoxy-D-xylulose-5-phosphate synthase
MLTLEEGSIGGFGSHVMDLLARNAMLDKGLQCRNLTLPDRYIDHGVPDHMYDEAGLNAAQIVAQVHALLGTQAAQIVDLKPSKAE